MRSDKEICQASELICRVLEGEAGTEEIRQLEAMLHRDPEVLSLYTQISDTLAELMCPGPSMGISYQAENDQELGLDMHLWKQLQQEEETAPTLQISRAAVDERLPIIKSEPRPMPHRMSKFTLISVITSAAALLLLVLFARFGPSRPMPVATVRDTFQAQWQGRSPEPGSRLTNRPLPLRLLAGYAKLQFDNGAEVIVEGPCDFQLDSADQMQLIYGKLVAVVPAPAAGFRVNTAFMSVTDLGTEFSIQIDERGATVNLYKGRASLLAGTEGHRKGSHLLAEGQALHVDPQTQQVRAVGLDEQNFVRRLDSQKEFLWRGESISLASIIAGGDGFSVIPGINGIDPGTGKPVQGYEYRVQSSSGTYQPVGDNPFVDGVFIPDGGLGDNIISSAGHVFKECPDTVGANGNAVGATSHDILAFCGFDEQKVTLKSFLLPVFDGITMGTSSNPAVLMHSNSGITFDLDAIRSQLPEMQLQRLVCSIGLPNRTTLTGATADVWVLLDGQIRYVKRELVQADGMMNLSVDIAPQERFLTIAVTDAAAAAKPGVGTFDNDYVYLITPRLNLTGMY